MEVIGARHGRAPNIKRSAGGVTLALALNFCLVSVAEAAVSIYGRALSDEPVEYLQDEETLAPQAALPPRRRGRHVQKRRGGRAAADFVSDDRRDPPLG